MVDELHDVKEFGPDQILPSPFYSEGKYGLIQQLIKANRGALLIQGLGVQTLFAVSMEGA